MSLLLNHLVEFGPYVFDVLEGRLTRGKQQVDLPPRSVAVLRYLIQNRDRTISKEELKAKLWPEVHVAPASIHKQVSELRLALGQVEGESTYIKTEYTRGWRFVAEVRDITATEEVVATPVLESTPAVPQTVDSVHRVRGPLTNWLLVLAMCFSVSFLTVAVVLLIRPPSVPVVKYEQLTNDGLSIGGPILTDGKRIYFSYKSAGTVQLASIPVGGGDRTLITSSVPVGHLVEISPDGSSLLFESTGAVGRSLWKLPVTGGEAKQLMGIAGQASWSPDGRTLAFSPTESSSIVFQDERSKQSHSFAVNGKVEMIRWAPDGRRVRVSVFDPTSEKHSTWEVCVGGADPRELASLAEGKEIAENGGWSLNGRAFFYGAGDYFRRDLWPAPDGVGSAFVNSRPIALTSGLGSWDYPIALPGSRIAALKTEVRSELVSLDSRSGKWKPMWNAAPILELEYSRDGAWVAFTHLPDNTIWKSRADGNGGVRLTDPGIEAHQAHWSPDGQRIAFMGKNKAGQWRIFLVSADGGPTQELLEEGEDQGVPTWSADGRYLLFGDRLTKPAEKMMIHLVDVATREVVDLEHSGGLWSPRLAPDGKSIMAITCDSKSLRIRPWSGGAWLEITRMQYIDQAMWSADSKYIYFNGMWAPQKKALFRVSAAGGKWEQLVDLNDFVDAQQNWQGVAPDGTLLASRGVVSTEIWALTYQLPWLFAF